MCPWCGKIVPAYVPRGGDGSGLRLRRHTATRKSRNVCKGTYYVVDGAAVKRAAVDDK